MNKKIKAKWIIKIPLGSKVLVNMGDKVKSGEILAKIINRKVESFNFSKFLGKLSKQKLEELNQKFKNSWVNNSELICLSGGIFPNKICFPMSGNFLGIDEFCNLKIEKIDEKETEVFSPTDAKVLKIEEDKIILNFEAKEFKGKGIVEGKSWGYGILQVINKEKDLDFKSSGNILLTQNLTKQFLLKAEVVGIMAVLTKDNCVNEGIETELPLLALENEEWEELLRYKGTNRSILVNSRIGRLLLVLE